MSNNNKIIGTHSGAFHCDEALAVYLLKKTNQFAKATVVRSRDPKVWATCDILVDVGAEFDLERGRLDHHQNSFKGTFDENHSIKLSSAGLVYKYFGKEIIQNMTQIEGSLLDIVYNKMYDSFIQEIDAIDNGVNIAENTNYQISTGLSSRVGRLNPKWTEDLTEDEIFERFTRASELAGSEFVENLKYMVDTWVPARTVVEKAVLKRFEIHPSGTIIALDQYCPWTSHLFDIQAEQNISINFVLFPEKDKSSFRVQAVPEKPGSFVNKVDLKCKGLRDSELDSASGISGGVFVHGSGFIGGWKTYESAHKFASWSLEK